MISEHARQRPDQAMQPTAGRFNDAARGTVYEVRPRKDCRENVPDEFFFELYRRKTLVAARRSLARLSQRSFVDESSP